MSVPVVLHPRHEPGVKEALEAVPGITVVAPRDDDGVFGALSNGAPVLVTYTWEDRFLQPGLRWLQGHGAGYEQYPLDRFSRAGVVFTTASGIHPAAAEHVWALILALTRGIAQSVRAAGARRWAPYRGHELADRTLGVVGLGSIGEAVARRAAGWGMRVVGTKRNPKAYNGVVDDVRGPQDLLSVCRMSDVLVLAVPASEETDRLVGANELEALGPGWLINVSRGSVVDEEALVRALESGQLLGAGLDVFETEPLPTASRLWDLPNVVLTPHDAGLSTRYGERLAGLFRENLAAFNGRGQWRNRIV